LGEYAESLAKKLLTHKRIQKVNTNERLNWNEKNTEQLVLNFLNNTTFFHRAVLKFFIVRLLF
jgi:hypothetical protein